MNIEPHDIGEERGKLALERLQQGIDVIQAGNISLTNYKNEDITLLVWSNSEPENIDLVSARKELERGVDSFGQLMGQWPDLSKLLNGFEPNVYLHHDYGQGSVRLCQLKQNGNIQVLHPCLEKT